MISPVAHLTGKTLAHQKGVDIKLRPTGYDDAALSSYKEFVRLRGDGVIEPKIRFQVCLSTPINVLTKRVSPEYQAETEPVSRGCYCRL